MNNSWLINNQQGSWPWWASVSFYLIALFNCFVWLLRPMTFNCFCLVLFDVVRLTISHPTMVPCMEWASLCWLELSLLDLFPLWQFHWYRVSQFCMDHGASPPSCWGYDTWSIPGHPQHSGAPVTSCWFSWGSRQWVVACVLSEHPSLLSMVCSWAYPCERQVLPKRI